MFYDFLRNERIFISSKCEIIVIGFNFGIIMLRIRVSCILEIVLNVVVPLLNVACSRLILLVQNPQGSYTLGPHAVGYLKKTKMVWWNNLVKAIFIAWESIHWIGKTHMHMNCTRAIKWVLINGRMLKLFYRISAACGTTNEGHSWVMYFIWWSSIVFCEFKPKRFVYVLKMNSINSYKINAKLK